LDSGSESRFSAAVTDFAFVYKNFTNFQDAHRGEGVKIVGFFSVAIGTPIRLSSPLAAAPFSGPGVTAMGETHREPAPAWRFPTTHWSCVAEAGDPDPDRSRAALAELCGAYWYPLYAFVRRRGHAADEADDLVQEYFARLLEKGVLSSADRDRGRFRAFLMADCSYFLSHERARVSAQKWGGGRAAVSIDVRDAEGRFLSEPADGLTPEQVYERAWALALLGRVLDALRDEYARGGRGEVFERLKPVLTDGPGAVPYAEVAAALGSTEGAVQAAVHRLRRRYGDLLRGQIAATVGDPADVDDEIRSLFAALGS
jgi:DNA-directed RNA polymerase specialized sigma24 family protein